MAKKKFTDVYVSNNTAAGTKGNDIFHIKQTDADVKITSANKGSDVLYIEGIKDNDVKNLTFSQGVDTEAIKQKIW